MLPEFQSFVHHICLARPVCRHAGGDDPSACEAVIEDDEAVVEADMEDREFEVVDGVLFQSRLDELFKIVTPIAEATAQREREIGLVEQFVAGDESIEQVPRIAVQLLVTNGAVRARRFKLDEGLDRNEGVARMVRIKELAAQQHEPRLLDQPLRQRLGRVLGANFLYYRMHTYCFTSSHRSADSLSAYIPSARWRTACPRPYLLPAHPTTSRRAEKKLLLRSAVGGAAEPSASLLMTCGGSSLRKREGWHGKACPYFLRLWQ